MEITYLHQYFNTTQMAGGTRSYEMAKKLVKRGHVVNMITSWRSKDRRTEWFYTNEDGINVHWLPLEYSNKMSYKNRIKTFFRFAYKSAVKATSIRSDLIFATSTPLTIALPAVYASKRLKVPLVFEVRDLWPELPFAVGAIKNPVAKKAAKYLEKFAYYNSENVIALSPGMRDGILKTDYPTNRVHVIPNSADIELFNSNNFNSNYMKENYPELCEKPLVVYTGTMGLINGVNYLPLIASAALKEGFDINFAIFGKGYEESKVRNKAEELGVLGANLYMYPSVPKKEIPNILFFADLTLSLFVNLKPMWANSANKFFDSLAAGTPIAINYGGWQAELINKEKCGIILPPEDYNTAASIINQFVSNKDKLNSAGRAAKKLAKVQFSRNSMANKLESVLTCSLNEFKNKVGHHH